jgi:uncharacterized protein (DUF427 family)
MAPTSLWITRSAGSLGQGSPSAIFRYDPRPVGIEAQEKIMQAVVDGQVVAQSNDVIDCKGYQYFPSTTVRLDWLEKVEKSADDHACPHGVQFYDVVVSGRRHPRAAWSYESPRPEMASVGGRFGFWQDVKVA